MLIGDGGRFGSPVNVFFLYDVLTGFTGEPILGASLHDWADYSVTTDLNAADSKSGLSVFSWPSLMPPPLGMGKRPLKPTSSTQRRLFWFVFNIV